MKYIEAVHAQGSGMIASRASIMQQLALQDLVPWRSGPLVLTGMGASYNAILTVLPFYRSRLVGPVWGGLASDLLGWRSVPGAEHPAVIAVSQSGQSREVVESLESLPTRARLGLTAQPGSAIAAVVDATVDLSVPEDSAVRVIGYSASVQALFMMGEALAGANLPSESPDALFDQLEAWAQAAELTANAFLDDGPCPESIDFVGTGRDAGSAAQGALLVREACRLHSAGYDTYQYLHGPVEAVHPGAVLVAIGNGREVALARSLAQAGARVLLVTEAAVGPEAGMRVFQVQGSTEQLSWLPAVVLVQVLAWHLAQRLGLAVGTFQHHQDDTKVA